MNRLTQKNKRGGYLYAPRDEKKIADKLGEYEDTGLKPKEIRQLIDFLSVLSQRRNRDLYI